MREKIYIFLNRIYGVFTFVSFFAGLLPLFPYIIAVIIGGSAAEKISLFLYNEYYPWVIATASIAVVIGCIAMYLGKQQGFSIKKKKEDEQAPKCNEQSNDLGEEV